MTLPISISAIAPNPWVSLGPLGSAWVLLGLVGGWGLVLRTEYHKLSYLVPSLESSVSVVELEPQDVGVVS